MPAPVDVLVVDDRTENLVALQAILESPEYRLVTATSGPQALEAVARQDFALILLDVAMPGMTGFDVADRLKQDARTKHVPILFLTAVATGLDEIYRAYQIGAVDYVVKPLNVAAVRAKVAVFADVHRQRQVISRHLREPLESVLAEAQRIRKGLSAGEPPAQLEACAERIERAAEGMHRLLLDVDGSRGDGPPPGGSSPGGSGAQ